jgi:hypothetical protein
MGSLALWGVRRGESGSKDVASRAVSKLGTAETHADPATLAAGKPSATGAASGKAARAGAREGGGPRLDRARADAMRQRATQRLAAERARHTPPATAEGSPGAAAPHQSLTPEEEKRRREYIRDAIRQQYFPIARSCYQELLDRRPNAGGKVTMSFSIVGDGDAGVVSQVDLDDEAGKDPVHFQTPPMEGSEPIEDPEFRQCMRESMYSTIFEPPPPGEETTVVYPIELRPGP